MKSMDLKTKVICKVALLVGIKTASTKLRHLSIKFKKLVNTVLKR